jgi:hypothetical protein
MMKFLNALESTDSICDDASTDASSTRSSYQEPSAFEDVTSGSESEDNVSATNSESAKVQPVASLTSESLEANQLYNNKDAFFRNNYINKLTNMKIMRPQHQSKSHQTLVIFDWDDTLFPTTFLTYVGFEKVQTEAKIQNLLNKIDKLVSKLLLKAIKFGKTCIVTNASHNWVETSSQNYLPMTYEVLRRNDISVISARAKYEKQFPNEPKRWKQEAFVELRANLNGEMLANIICIGDSTLELEAAQHFCSALSQAILKTIKFKQAPRIEELLKQQEVVLEKFAKICVTLRSLTIKVEKKN